MFIFLGFELLCLINVCKAHFEATEYEPCAHHAVAYEWLLIYTVTIPEGIAIKEDVSQNPRPTHGGKNMDSKPLVTTKETGIRFIKCSVCIGRFHPNRSPAPAWA
jgi:formate dehydrogenase maturation protein FdhE